jgi:predicted 2-oxoglutarate/Fe(II)-dependent dioxygenase YbiX
MIEIYQNYVSQIEINEILEFFNKNIKDVKTHIDSVYRFNGISLLDNINNISFLKKLNYTNYDRIRIQHVDKNVDMITNPHKHHHAYSFVVFLNDEYEGGELIFDNVTFKPKVGQLICFSGNEPHYVKNVTNGDRYTLVSFFNDKINFNKIKLM